MKSCVIRLVDMMVVEEGKSDHKISGISGRFLQRRQIQRHPSEVRMTVLL